MSHTRLSKNKFIVVNVIAFINIPYEYIDIFEILSFSDANEIVKSFHVVGYELRERVRFS